MEKTSAQEAYQRYKVAQRQFTTLEGIPVGPELSQYADKVRDYELGGTGIGALGGLAIGHVLGKGRLPGYLLGTAGGGLLGKYFGRQLGERQGLQQLSVRHDIPFERSLEDAIIQSKMAAGPPKSIDLKRDLKLSPQTEAKVPENPLTKKFKSGRTLGVTPQFSPKGINVKGTF